MSRFRIPGPLGIHVRPDGIGAANCFSADERSSAIRETGISHSTTIATFAHRSSPVADTQSEDFVTVFVWVSLIKAKSPGHAAMAIRPNATTPADGYVSFAPEASGSISGPGFFYPWDHDVEHYGDIQTKGTGRGLWTARIYGLDTKPMKQRLEKDLKKVPPYSLGNQCATTVHRYLQLGGGDEFASWWSRHVIGFWSPDDVEDYARSIVEHTASFGSTGKKYAGDGTVFK